MGARFYAMRNWLILPLGFLACDVQGVSHLSFDAASMALGDAGAMTGMGGDRPNLNPAIFNSLKPEVEARTYIGARFLDKDNLVDTFDDVENTYDKMRIEQKMRRVKHSFEKGDYQSQYLRDVSEAAIQVADDVELLAGRYLRISSVAGLQVVTKNQNFSVSFYTQKHLLLNGVVRNDPNDLYTIRQLSKFALSLADTIDNVRQAESKANAVPWQEVEDVIRAATTPSLLEGIYDKQIAIGKSIEDELHQTFDQLKVVEDMVKAVDWPSVEDVVKAQLKNNDLNRTLKSDEFINTIEQIKTPNVEAVLEQLETTFESIDWDRAEQILKNANAAEKLEEEYQVAQAGADVSVLSINNTAEDLKSIKSYTETIETPDIKAITDQTIDLEEIEEGLGLFQIRQEVQTLVDTVKELKTNIDELRQHIDLESLAARILRDRNRSAQADATIPTKEEEKIDLREFMLYPIPEEINTVVVFTGAEITETAASFAMEPPVLEGLSVGINLKQQRYSTIAYTQRVDQVELEEYKRNYTRQDYNLWNLDVGMKYQLNDQWTVGGAVQNILTKHLQNRLGHDIELKPSARAGVAFQSLRLSFAADIDLQKNTPPYTDGETQYLSVGGALNIWRRSQLRLGYRYNIPEDSGVPALGFGIGGNQFTFDLAATYAEKTNEGGVAMQLSVFY